MLLPIRRADQPPASAWRAVALSSLLALLIGCASAPPPPVAESEASREPAPPARPPTAAEASPPPADPTPAPAAPSADPQESDKQGSDKPDTTDVVEPGGEPGTVSLVQAAKTERERRAHATPPVAVITDKSLPHLPKGKVTYADPAKKKAAPTAGTPADARDEQYWRSRGLEIRTRWKQAADAVKDLELSAAGWRRRFYAEDDPYVRDGQIKPEWDRVLDRLGKSREEVEAAQRELADYLEEGRRAGALPGWLREGAELEPADGAKKKEPGTAEPKEPPIYHQNDGGAVR